MKGTEFWKHNYPDVVGVQVDEEGNIIEKVDLGVVLEAYHQAELKLLGIGGVVGQSELLPCGDLIKHNFSLSKIGRCITCDRSKDKAR